MDYMIKYYTSDEHMDRAVIANDDLKNALRGEKVGWKAVVAAAMNTAALVAMSNGETPDGFADLAKVMANEAIECYKLEPWTADGES